MGVVCGLTAGVVAFFWHHNPILGLVVGLAMTSAISAASVLGTLAPALFKLMNVDPAISSGPVVATLNDILGLLIYFGISTVFYSVLIQ
jgi:magnesium transporter